MQLMKINLVSADAVVDNTASIIDVSSVMKIVTAATTSTMTYYKYGTTLATVIFTVDGANTAEKLLNAQKITDYLGEKVALMGSGRNKGVLDLIPDYATFETATGIVFTGDTGPLVSVTYSG